MVLAPTTVLVEMREPFIASRGPANHSHVLFARAGFAPQGLQSGLAATMATPSRGCAAVGQQNKLGNYHCNNRVYSIGASRWLSPDQAARPSWNLFDYVGQKATQLTDPNGLTLRVTGDRAYQEAILAALVEICPTITSFDIVDGYIVPTEYFCKGASIYNDAGQCIYNLPGWLYPGHNVGCELLHCLICSKYLVEIKAPAEGVNNHYEYGNVDAKGNVVAGDPKGNPSDARRTVKDGKWDKAGKGSGGTVHIGKNAPPGTWNGKDGAKIPKTLARALAHELGHACNGVRGDVEMDNLGENMGHRFQPVPGPVCGASEREWIKKNPDDYYKGTGDWEERRVIKNWENPIAKEMDRNAVDRIDHAG